MKLFEHEGKTLLAAGGIQVPEGVLVSTVVEAEHAFQDLQGKVVLKAQLLSGSRGKRGGIRFAQSRSETGAIAGDLFDSALENHQIPQLLIERHIPATREYYLAITIDAQLGQPLLLFSPQGGVDIEESSAADTQLLRRYPLDTLEGLQPYVMRRIAQDCGLDAALGKQLGDIAQKLYSAFVSADAVLAEINPLALTDDNKLTALDAKFDIDDYALNRNSQWQLSEHLTNESASEAKARLAGLTYVKLDGDIGIAGNGAGLMMLTVDLVYHYGGKAANFCDAGGARAQPGTGEPAIRWWSDVVSIVLSNTLVRVLLFNLHGGNHRGDEVAQGLIRALERADRHLPIAVRLSGTRQAEGRQMLQAEGIESYDTMDEVVRAAVSLSQRSAQ